MVRQIAPPNTKALRIERLLADFLYKQGNLPLPGLGTIRFSGAGEVEHDEATGRYRFDPESLSFDYDTKTELDEELVSHISRETGKMKALAAADLHSFLHFGMELINISKPFQIEGLGLLQKTPAHVVEFVPEQSPKPQAENPVRSARETRRQRMNREPYVEDPMRTRRRRMPSNLIWGGAILVSMAAAFAWFKYFEGRGADASDDASPTVTLGTQTAGPSPDSTGASTAVKTNASFHVVLENSHRERALRRYADLREWGHDVRMVTSDSQSFKLFIPIDAPLSDTAFHRDSLRVFFGRPVTVEIAAE